MKMKRNEYGAIILSNKAAKVLFQRYDHSRKEWVVMASYLGKYVTWICYANETTGEYDPEHGNYFGRVGNKAESNKAYNDYMSR